jgi:general secretion pathway protein M
MKTAWLTFRKRHWDDRARQERRIILLGALVLAPLLGYFVLWQPAHVMLPKLHASLPALRTQAAQMRTHTTEAEMLRHLPHPAVLDASALKTAVEESAARHQLRDALTSLEAQEPNAVRITSAAVSLEHWLAWLRDMQQEQHIRADSVSIAALPQTGMVKINATLTNGGTE